jgi:hypothetical protein
MARHNAATFQELAAAAAFASSSASDRNDPAQSSS